MPIPPFAEINAAIANHQKFAIVAHVGPDGDAIGSGLALCLALKSMGKNAVVISTDGVPAMCRFLPQWETVARELPQGFKPQCVFILDCDVSSERMAAPKGMIETAPYRVLIDHHRSTKPTFEVNWIDISQPATSQMIFQLVEQMPIPITPDIAQCLMTGLSTDTGHFRFTNVTPDTFRAAARLTECGADGSIIAFKTFDERSFESTQVLGMALSKMQSGSNGQLMWVALAAKDFEGAGEDSSENVVNFLRNVRGARMAIMMKEKGDDNGSVTRISVRSEAVLRADLFCAKFSGGGHAAAAGGRIRDKSFEESVKIIVQAASDWLAEDHADAS